MIIRGAILICFTGLLVACSNTIPVTQPTVESALGRAMNENADAKQAVITVFPTPVSVPVMKITLPITLPPSA